MRFVDELRVKVFESRPLHAAEVQGEDGASGGVRDPSVLKMRSRRKASVHSQAASSLEAVGENTFHGFERDAHAHELHFPRPPFREDFAGAFGRASGFAFVFTCFRRGRRRTWFLCV